MKRIYSVMAAVAATLAFAACSEIEIESAAVDPVDQDLELIENGNMEVTFNCTMEDVEDPVATRTEFHDNTIWWSEGDVIAYYQRYIKTVGGSYSIVYSNRTVNAAQESYSTTISFTKPAEFPAYYWALYPFGSVASSRTSFTGETTIYASMTVPAEQNPTLDSFDPAADALVSEYIEASEQQSAFNMRFRRVVALGKMTIKNLPSASEIESIIFENKNAYIAGTGYYELENAATRPSVKSGTGSSSITMNYTESVTANSASGMTAYFTCRAFTLSEGQSFTVTVNTVAGETFTKTVMIPSGREIKFEEGKGTRFNVDMSTAEKTCEWFKVSKSSTASTYNAVYGRIERLNNVTITSVKYCWVQKSELASITDIDDYVETNGTALESTGTASLESINANKALTVSKTSATIDTEYVLIVKAIDADSNNIILTFESKTTWFGVRAVANSTAGKVNGYFFGVDLESMSYKMVSVSTLEGKEKSEYEEYFNTLTVSDGASKLSDINSAGSSGKGYAFSVASGSKYVLLAKAVNKKGESMFVYSSEVTAK